MKLNGDSDDNDPKRSIVLNPSRDLRDSKFEFVIDMIPVEVEILSGQHVDFKVKRNL